MHRQWRKRCDDDASDVVRYKALNKSYGTCASDRFAGSDAETEGILGNSSSSQKRWRTATLLPLHQGALDCCRQQHATGHCPSVRYTVGRVNSTVRKNATWTKWYLVDIILIKISAAAAWHGMQYWLPVSALPSHAVMLIRTHGSSADDVSHSSDIMPLNLYALCTVRSNLFTCSDRRPIPLNRSSTG